MERTMVFIDHENLHVARSNLYRWENPSTAQVPFLDFVEFPKKLVKRIDPGMKLVKTFLFVPKPEGVLKEDEARCKRYEFLKGIENTNYYSVISGRHIARPTSGYASTIDLDKRETYYVQEKGTDVNIATKMLTIAFHNGYDTAVVVSGDTDLIPVYDVLGLLGKTVIVVVVKNQNLTEFRTHTDRQFVLDGDFLLDCENHYVKGD